MPVRDMATALVGAVARGEISAVFQPQIDVATGGIVGVEALCRWTHPTWGSVPPEEFIAVAEETGLIHEIGHFMAEECCRAFAAWSTPEHPVDVSVNVSPVQLETAEFTEWLAGCLADEAPPVGVFTLEITESRPIADVATVLRRLEPLRELGVGIALDDLGIGHASLTQLRRLHGTEVKLDRSLVTDESEDGERTIARVVDIAHRAGIRVVAEGVETTRDLDRVRRLGCDRAQGYLLGRPMTADAIARLIA